MIRHCAIKCVLSSRISVQLPVNSPKRDLLCKDLVKERTLFEAEYARVWSEEKYRSLIVATQSASSFTLEKCSVAPLATIHMDAAALYRRI